MLHSNEQLRDGNACFGQVTRRGERILERTNHNKNKMQAVVSTWLSGDFYIYKYNMNGGSMVVDAYRVR